MKKVWNCLRRTLPEIARYAKLPLHKLSCLSSRLRSEIYWDSGVWWDKLNVRALGCIEIPVLPGIIGVNIFHFTHYMYMYVAERPS